MLAEVQGESVSALALLMVAVQLLLDDQPLSLTELGRNITGEMAAKRRYGGGLFS